MSDTQPPKRRRKAGTLPRSGLKNTPTREGAILSVAYHGSTHKAAEAARAAGFTKKTSSDTFNRLERSSWRDTAPRNPDVVALACQDMAQFVAEETARGGDAPDVESARQWFHLNLVTDYVLASWSDPRELRIAWALSRAAADAALATPRDRSPLACVLHATAYMHKVRNPDLGAADTAAALSAARDLIDDFLAEYSPGYAYGKLSELTGAHRSDLSAKEKRAEFFVQPEGEPLGILVSAMTHFRNELEGRGSDAQWLRSLTELKREGLLHLLASRGLFFRETKTLVNAAEAYWMLGETDDARVLVRQTAAFDDKLMQELASPFSDCLEAEFRAFATNLLAPN